jgi:hypothetical protein
MAEHYIEEYLVSLGFDVSSKQGQEYADMLADIEKRMQDLEKAGTAQDKQEKTRQGNQQKRTADTKKEINLMGDMKKTIKQVGGALEDIGRGNVFGALVKGTAGAKSLADFMKSLNQTAGETGSKSETFKKVIRDIFEQQTGTKPASEPAKKAPETAKEAPAAKAAPRETPEVPEEAPKNAPVSEPTMERKPTQEPQTTPEAPKAKKIRVNLQPRETPQKPEDSAVAPAPEVQKKATEVQKNAPETTAASGVKKAAVEQAKGFQVGTVEEQGIEAGMTGETAGTAAGAAEAGAGAAAVVGGAVVAGIAVAAIAATAAIEKMTDSLSKANTDIESMSAQMWISYDSALKLNNTLTAMGKTTADLNEIALNPTLKKQFEDLQKYQETALQFPTDYKETNDQFAETVGTANAELKMSVGYMGKLAAYDLEKTFGPGLEALAKTVLTIVNGINAILEFFGKGNQLTTDPTTGKRTITGSGGLIGSSGSSTSNGSSSGSDATGYTNYAAGSYYAPQTSSYSTSSTASNVTLHNTPSITINASSSDPQSIASATSDAVSSSLNQTALIKSIQGANR